MPKTRISCPNCRQPILADIEQLFDVGVNPTAKSELLSGGVNYVRCQNCGYEGNLATPLVYHDPQKELLLTYFPAELSMPRNEQERIIGGLINQVVMKLPQEKRKAYLLQPQSVLTMQGMIERVLEADGVTREMVQEQQKRLALLQRLLAASPDVRQEIIKSEEGLIDADFFSLLARLAQATVASGDKSSAEMMSELQNELLRTTAVGQEIQNQASEVDAAIATLREAGEELTREKLLDMMIKAPNDTRLSVLVSLTRPGLDYEFFRMLSDRIDRARPDGRARLVALREKLLEMTQEIDKQTEMRVAKAQELLQGILQAEDLESGVANALPVIDDLFMQVLTGAIESARKGGDLEKLNKLTKVEETISEFTTPPEISFIEDLLSAENDENRRKLLESNKDKVTTELVEALTNITAQMDASENNALAESLKSLHRMVLRYSMEMNLRK